MRLCNGGDGVGGRSSSASPLPTSLIPMSILPFLPILPILPILRYPARFSCSITYSSFVLTVLFAPSDCLRRVFHGAEAVWKVTA